MNSSKFRGKESGFSLVEVVMALAVVAFALTVIVALLITAISSSKSAMEDTRLAKMSSEVVSDLRQAYFVSPAHPAAAANVLAASNDLTTTSPSPIYFWFDAGGVLLGSGTAGTPPTGVVYTCTVSFQINAATRGSVGSNGSTSYQAVNFIMAELLFSWPGHTSAGTSKIFYASLARY